MSDPDNSSVYGEVVKYLQSADLARVGIDDIAWKLNLKYPQIDIQLRERGTNWETLKRSEKVRRLMLLLRNSERLDVQHCCERLGFEDPSSVWRFFKSVMGETYTDYMARQ